MTCIYCVVHERHNVSDGFTSLLRSDLFWRLQRVCTCFAADAGVRDRMPARPPSPPPPSPPPEYTPILQQPALQQTGFHVLAEWGL